MDNWTQEGTLCEVFHRLFYVSIWKRSNVKHFLETAWNVDVYGRSLWSRPLRQWEREEALKLWNIVIKVHLSNRNGQLIWDPSGNPLTAKDCYQAIIPSQNVVTTELRLLWKLRLPPKVQIFLWFFLSNSLSSLAKIKVKMVF